MAHRAIASLAVVAGVLFWLMPPAPALAQNPEIRELMNKLERVQRELTTLQRSVYRGKAPAPTASGGGRFDQRIAARAEVRLSQLETQLQRVTGKAEELEHAIGQFSARLEKLVSDVDVRLSALEQRPGGAADAPPAPPPLGAPRAGGAAVAAPAGVLGTIPARRRDRTPPAAQTAAKSALPSGSPQKQYEYATSLLLADQNIEEAERALRAFIDSHPKHRLTSNAHYWLGETYYVRKNFQQAAYAFADGFQRFPKSRKAADNLLKLGMSLGQLGKTKQACTAFSRLLGNFPQAGRTLKGRVSREQRRLKCR